MCIRDSDYATFAIVFGDVPLTIGPRPGRLRSSGFAGYRRANETQTTQPREPFAVDPNEVDRALRAHADTQNALADWLILRGLTPLSPTGTAANFDLAWLDSGALFVAEVKSLNEFNETRQLRLGLGQVLHYQALLEEKGQQVRAILVVEHRPRDDPVSYTHLTLPTK